MAGEVQQPPPPFLQLELNLRIPADRLGRTPSSLAVLSSYEGACEGGHSIVWGLTLLGYCREMNPTEKIGHSNFLYSRIMHFTREVSDYWILCAEMPFVRGCIYYTLQAKYSSHTFCPASAYKSSCCVGSFIEQQCVSWTPLNVFSIFSWVNRIKGKKTKIMRIVVSKVEKKWSPIFPQDKTSNTFGISCLHNQSLYR